MHHCNDIVNHAMAAAIFLAGLCAGVVTHDNRQIPPIYGSPPFERADPVLWGAPSGAEELESNRTTDSKTFRNADGTLTTVLGQNIHYEASPGVFEPVSFDFVASGSNEVMQTHPNYTSTISDSGVELAATADGKGVRWVSSAHPSVSGNTASFTSNGLIWTYEAINGGLKATASVGASLGPKVYSFEYALVGGAADFTIDGSGNAVGDGFTVPRVIIIGADRVVRVASAWSKLTSPSRLVFSYDDSALPAHAYPYVIDPTTTLQPGSGGFDARIHDAFPTTNDGTGTTLTVGDADSGNAEAYRTVIKFDLSSIPSSDAITGVSLDLYEATASDSQGVGSWAIDLQKVRQNWVEGDVTWNIYSTGNAWSSAGAADTTNDIYSTVSATRTDDGTAASAFVSWTGAQLLKDVQDFHTGTLPNYGWRIRAPLAEGHAAGDSFTQYSSSDHGTAAQHPRLVVTHVTPTLAITGTLGDGATAAQVRAGGQTTILTLTGTTWAASGSTFDLVRRQIYDGLVSNLDDQNGWNYQRVNLPISDVARTSDTVVTITHSALPNYAVPGNETLTATVPAAATAHTAAITGAPTFDITPSFSSSGTWVSPAIDASAVTDVAYCAFGWEPVTPAGTTITVETSVDGGSNYSTATNGACPTGISVGASLASITDMRIRLTLTTADSSVTPIVDGLGLIIEDDAGQDLYYQLNTTPSATLTDRSGSGNTGTMSFPAARTDLLATTDPLESTRTQLTAEQALGVSAIASEVSGSAVSDNLFSTTETGDADIPGYGLITAMAGAGDGLPVRLIWFIFFGFVTLVAGALTMLATKSLGLAALAMAAMLGFGAAINDGLIPGWTIFVFLPIAGAMVLIGTRNRLPT